MYYSYFTWSHVAYKLNGHILFFFFNLCVYMLLWFCTCKVSILWGTPKYWRVSVTALPPIHIPRSFFPLILAILFFPMQNWQELNWAFTAVLYIKQNKPCTNETMHHKCLQVLIPWAYPRILCRELFKVWRMICIRKQENK